MDIVNEIQLKWKQSREWVINCMGKYEIEVGTDDRCRVCLAYQKETLL